MPVMRHGTGSQRDSTYRRQFVRGYAAARLPRWNVPDAGALASEQRVFSESETCYLLSKGAQAGLAAVLVFRYTQARLVSASMSSTAGPAAAVRSSPWWVTTRAGLCRR